MKDQPSVVILHSYKNIFKKSRINFQWIFLPFLLLLFSINLVFAQPTIEWETELGGDEVDQFLGIESTPDGGYIAVGDTKSDIDTNEGDRDFWIAKIDASGTLVWQKTYGGSDVDIARAVKNTDDGGFVVVGLTESDDGDVTGNNNGISDFWIIKLDGNGELIWEKKYGGTSLDNAYDVVQTNDGGYAVTGYSNSMNGDISGSYGNADMWLVKLSPNGDLLWENSYGGSGFEIGFKIFEKANGNLVLGGNTGSNSGLVSSSIGALDFWIVELNAGGDLIQENSYGGTESDYLLDLITTNDGGYFAVGRSLSSDVDVPSNGGSFDKWVVKLNSNFEIEWTKSYGFDAPDVFSKVAQLNNGKYVVLDNFQRVTQLDAFGIEEYYWAYGDLGTYKFNNLKATADGEFLIVGSKGDEGLVLKTGTGTPTPCPDAPSGFSLLGEFNGHKYYLSEGTSGAPAAQDVAVANGGYLAVINSQEENDFIQQNISEMVYIGLNDFDAEGNLVWVNGDPLDFNNINPCGFCNENAEDQDFLIIQPWDGAWSFSNIFNQRKYIIEVPCSGTTPPTNPADCSFLGKFDLFAPPNVVCVEESADEFLITSFTRFQFINPLFYFKNRTSISLEGAVTSNIQSPEFDPYIPNTFPDLPIFLSHSKMNPWTYVYDVVLDKVIVYDENYVQISEIDLPFTPNYNLNSPISLVHNLNTLQVKEFGDFVLVAMDGFAGLYETQTGQLLIENFGFADGTKFGIPIKNNVGGYFIQAGNLMVSLADGLTILWTREVSDEDEEVTFTFDPSNTDYFFYYLKDDENQNLIYKLNSHTGELIWEKELSSFLPTNANLPQYQIVSAVASKDGGVVAKINYGFNNSTIGRSTIIKLDENGNLVWQKQIPQAFIEYELYHAANDGGYLLLNYWEFDEEAGYLKINSLGEFDPGCPGFDSPDLTKVTFGRISNFSELVAGDELEFFMRITNIGLADAIGNFKVNTYMSNDFLLDGDDYLVKSIDISDILIGEQKSFDLDFTVPAGLPIANYRLIVSIDDTDEFVELDETNNLTGTGFYPYVDNTSPNNCPDDIAGFVSLGEFGDSKYFLSEDEENPIPAQVIAENLGGYLASIDNQEENDFLFSQISEIAYIGINDAANENELVWENGDPVSFTNFDLCGICNENSEEMDFVVMHSWNGGWSWSNIFNQRKYIVEIPCTSTTDPLDNTLIAFLPNVLEEEKSKLTIEKIYPNPAESEIFISIKSFEERNVGFQIFDSRGTLVQNKTMNLQVGGNKVALSISDLPTGVYMIYFPELESKNNVQRFMKMD